MKPEQLVEVGSLQEHSLPVMERFYTIQGEGHFQGHAAYFIRLAGCDVGCHWCDVKESWDEDAHPLMDVKDLTRQAVLSGSKIAVVTGGEPLMHDNTYLCDQLGQAGLRRHIETSGAHPISGEWDWVCLSPKKFKAPLDEICELADELKVIIYNKSDFDWALEYKEKVGSDCKLFLQPEWSRRDKVTPLIVDFVKANPEWIISIQTHKYLNVP